MSLFAWAGGGHAAAQTATTLDRAGYVRLLHDFLRDLDGVATLDTEAQAAWARQARDRLPGDLLVRDAGGTLAAPDLAPVRTALTAVPPDIAGARRFLAALLDMLDPGSVPPQPTRPPQPAPSPTPGGDPGTPTPPAAATPGVAAYLPPVGANPGPPLGVDEAGRRLDAVLRDPRFAPAQGGGLQEGLAGLLQPVVQSLLDMPGLQRTLLAAAIAGLLVSFLTAVGNRHSGGSRARYWAIVAGSGAGTALAVFLLLTWGASALGLLGPVALPVGGSLGLLAALAVVGFAARNLRRNRAPDAARHVGGFTAEAGWTAAQARAAAQTAAAEGDYRRAMRYRYLATLLALDEAERLRFDPALTDGEYLRRAPAALREALRPLVLGFQRVWYGGYPAGAADYAHYQTLAAGAETAASEPAP